MEAQQDSLHPPLVDKHNPQAHKPAMHSNASLCNALHSNVMQFSALHCIALHSWIAYKLHCQLATNCRASMMGFNICPVTTMVRGLVRSGVVHLCACVVAHGAPVCVHRHMPLLGNRE